MRSSSCSRPGGPREPRGRQWCSGCAPHSSRGRRRTPSVAVGRAYEGTYRECPTPVPTRSAEQLRRRRIHGAGYERGVVADVHGGHVPHGLSSSNRRSAARDPQDRSNRYTDVNPGKLHSATPRTSVPPLAAPAGHCLSGAWRSSPSDGRPSAQRRRDPPRPADFMQSRCARSRGFRNHHDAGPCKPLPRHDKIECRAFALWASGAFGGCPTSSGARDSRRDSRALAFHTPSAHECSASSDV